MARPASDISERILRSARDRFLEEGVDGASLRAIARDAGTNLGMVYYYYPTKDDLFLSVIESVYGRILEDISKPLTASDQTTEQKVRAVFGYFAALSDDDMKVVRLVLKEAMASSSRLGRIFERFSRGHVPMLVSMIITGMQRKEVRTDVPPIALALSTLALGILPQVLRRRLKEAGVAADALFPDPDVLGEALSSVLMHGIAVPKREPR
jgi:AcrR family transcriptional regulator